MFGVQNSLSIHVCATPGDAIAQGYNYSPLKFKALELEKAVIVVDGTEKHKSTVDLVLKDEQGNSYVVIVTGALLKAIPA